MQNFFTREDVLAYHQQGVQTIRLDSMPILTDLARETLQTLGMEIVTGAAPAALPRPWGRRSPRGRGDSGARRSSFRAVAPSVRAALRPRPGFARVPAARIISRKNAHTPQALFICIGKYPL